MATISRLLKIIGLFCKKALEKRLYPAKETYNLRGLLIVATPYQNRALLQKSIANLSSVLIAATPYMCVDPTRDRERGGLRERSRTEKGTEQDRERYREIERKKERMYACVCERERERERHCKTLRVVVDGCMDWAINVCTH